MSAWRTDLENVPERTKVLCYWSPVNTNDVVYEDYISQAFKQSGRWFKTRDSYGAPRTEMNEPTHWMPIPDPPDTEQQDG